MSVVEIADPVERSRICAVVLRDLPDWFGIEEATSAYIRDVAELPTFAVGDDALIALKTHNARAAEVYVMGVRREWHGEGLGTAVLDAGEAYLRDRGVEYLQVKTLGPSRPDAGYERTRGFYEARGFVALEELHDLWDANPCLLLVKSL
jgi:GNAT superfamily N-acetyltransferase